MARNEKNADTGPSADGKRKIRVRGGGWAALLFLTGAVLVTAGVGLATADHFSWQLVKLRGRIEPYGVQGASVALAGVVVLGMSFAARAAVAAAKSVARAAASNDQQDGLELIAGQVAGDLASVRQAVARVGESIGSLAASHNHVLGQLEQLGSPDESGIEQRDGLFRLAASLDKLGAQMDERLHGLDAKIREKIDHVAVAIDQARSSMENRMSAASTMAAPAATRGAATDGPFASQETQGTVGLVYTDEHGGGGTSKEELDVLVELEKELLDGKEPKLDFFDAVEEFDDSSSDADESIQLDLESPPSPFSNQARKPLDIVLPDDKFK